MVARLIRLLIRAKQADVLTCDDLRLPQDPGTGQRPLTRSERAAPQTPLASSVARYERIWGPKLGSTVGQTVYTFEPPAPPANASTTTPQKPPSSALPSALFASSPIKLSPLGAQLDEARMRVIELEQKLKDQDAALAKKDALLEEARNVAKKYKSKFKVASKALLEAQARLDEARRVTDTGRVQPVPELAKSTRMRPRRGKPLKGM